MKGQEKCDLLIQVIAWAGLTVYTKCTLWNKLIMSVERGMTTQNKEDFNSILNCLYLYGKYQRKLVNL
jgi:hypothetical protein